MSGSLMGEGKAKALLNMALNASPAEQTEVGLWSGQWALTRFANSVIHQNMTGRDAMMRVRAAYGKKEAAATTNDLTDAGIRELVERVDRMARLAGENPDFVSFPAPNGAAPQLRTHFEATASTGPEQRSRAVEAVVESAAGVDGTAAGSYTVREYEQGLMNSLGIDEYYTGTGAELVTVITGPDGGFGYANAQSRDAAAIDAAELGREAAALARDSRNPVGLEPGDYECVLMPYAVSDMLSFLVWMGFGAMAYQENRSCIVGRMGQQIVSEKVNIFDDASDRRTMVCPVDAEGVAKQRVDLVTNGVASGLLYDSYTAHREGKRSTGHSFGGHDVLSSNSHNLVMEPGTATVAEMIASTKRGVLVTRFHYTNIAHLMTASFTGMTRDGTFLIENGRVAGPVKNLRFTQSILEALLSLEMIGSEAKLVDGVFAPPLKIGKFRFSSATEF